MSQSMKFKLAWRARPRAKSASPANLLIQSILRKFVRNILAYRGEVNAGSLGIRAVVIDDNPTGPLYTVAGLIMGPVPR